MTDHPWAYAALFPASSLFWWFFEYLNRYVWNWYYLGISNIGAAEYTVYATVCFASVLPGVCAVAAFLHTFRPFADEHYAGMGRVNLRGWRAVSVLAFVAALGLTGIVFFPRYAYPLLWLSPLMVFLLVQVALKEPCALDCLAVGNWAVVLRFSLAALICGFCFQWCEQNPVAMNCRLTHTVYGISAHRADIKLRAEHIRGNIRIVNRISGYQLCDRNPERPCDWFQQGNVRVPFGSLPFRDRLVTYSKLFRQLKLGHFVSFTQFLNNRTCNILVHNRTLLSHRYRHSSPAGLPFCRSALRKCIRRSLFFL